MFVAVALVELLASLPPTVAVSSESLTLNQELAHARFSLIGKRFPKKSMLDFETLLACGCLAF
jgi:hypothetical protein